MNRTRTFASGLAIAALVLAGTVAGGQSATADVEEHDSYKGAHDASILGSGAYAFGFDNTDQTTEPGEIVTFAEPSPWRIFKTVWGKWTSPASGRIEVDTKGSALDDTTLAIYSAASSVKKAKLLAYNNNSAKLEPGKPLHSQIESFAVKKGVTYYFQAGSAGIDAASGQGVIYININPTFTPPSNDNLLSAVAKTGSSWTVSGTTIASTLEPTWENSDNGSDNTVWYRWKPTAAGTMVLKTATALSGPLYTAVWEKNVEGDFIKVGGYLTDDDAVDGTITQAIEPGSTYFLSVGEADGGASGAFTLNLHATYTGPTVTRISPASGTIKGGTKVTITGTRLSGVTKIAFGSLTSVGTKLKIVNSKKLTVVVPKGSRGKTWVLLSTAVTGNDSVINTASHFTYK